MSLGAVVDELVALDGRWKSYDDGSPSSSTAEEYDAIANGCITAGIKHRIIAHDRPWSSQVEKRAALMEFAGEDADWIFVLDGDEWLYRADGLALRASLELTGLNVATVTAQRTNEPRIKSGLPMRPYPIRRLYRARNEDGETVTVDVAHNGYRLGHDWLHGDPAFVTTVPALDLSRVVTIHHDAGRGAERRAKMVAYYRARKLSRAEAWRP